MADGALFPLGYGLTYASPATPWAPLPEVAVDAAADRHSWFAKGVPAASWSLVVAGPGGDRQTRLTAVPAKALGGRVIVTATDHRVQEGARRFAIAGGDAAIRLQRFEPLDLSREANGDVLLLATLKVAKAPARAEIAVAAGERIAAVPVSLPAGGAYVRSEEHTSELQSLMLISYAVFCLKKKNKKQHINNDKTEHNSCYK